MPKWYAKKVGPFPVGVYVAVGGGALALGLYMRKRTRAAAGEPAVDTTLSSQGTDGIVPTFEGPPGVGPTYIIQQQPNSPAFTPGTEQVFSSSRWNLGAHTAAILNILKNPLYSGAPKGTLQSLQYAYASRLYSQDTRNRDPQSFLRAFNQSWGTNFTLADLGVVTAPPGGIPRQIKPMPPVRFREN